MPRFIVFLTALFAASACFAELTAKDLPLIEGTPLEYLDDGSTNWTILDYQEHDAGLLWVWLQRESQQAYLNYPSESTDETFTFPDDTTVPVVANLVNITFITSNTQQVDLTRFGGKVTLDGRTISVSYTLQKFTDQTNGSFYASLNETGLDLFFDSESSASDDSINPKGHATISTTGGILSIAGPQNGINTLEGLGNSDNTWNVSEPNAGNLSLAGGTPISFTSIGNLVGGAGNDTFVFSSIESTLTSSIDGGGGNNILVLPVIESDFISTPTDSCGNVNGSQSSITISSGQQLVTSNPNSPRYNCLPNGFSISAGSVDLSHFTITEQEPVVLDSSQTTETAKRKHKSWAGFADNSTLFLLLLAPVFYRKTRQLKYSF